MRGNTGSELTVVDRGRVVTCEGGAAIGGTIEVARIGNTATTCHRKSSLAACHWRSTVEAGRQKSVAAADYQKSAAVIGASQMDGSTMTGFSFLFNEFRVISILFHMFHFSCF